MHLTRNSLNYLGELNMNKWLMVYYSSLLFQVFFHKWDSLAMDDAGAAASITSFLEIEEEKKKYDELNVRIWAVEYFLVLLPCSSGIMGNKEVF